MAAYRYIFVDILSNQVLAELPMTNVSYGQALNTAGPAQGKILLSGLDPSKVNAFAATLPEKCAWYIDRDGTIVWGGEIWSQRYTASTQILEITAREFESYFEARIINSTVVYANTDQLTIAQALINNAQAQTNGNIGVIVGTETSGVLINQSYYDYEEKSVFTALQELSKVINGFDFNIVCAYDGAGNITKTLRLGYPRYGKIWSATSQSATVVELPGNIIDYTYEADGTKGANTIYVTGAGSNEGMLKLVVQDATKLAAGYPLSEKSTSYPSISDPTVLTTLGNGELTAISSPPVALTVVIPAGIDPILGSYEIGDDVRVRILDSLFPNGIDWIYRLIAISVVAGETGPEEVTMTLAVKTS